MLNFCDFIQAFVFKTSHHLKALWFFLPSLKYLFLKLFLVSFNSGLWKKNLKPRKPQQTPRTKGNEQLERASIFLRLDAVSVT